MITNNKRGFHDYQGPYVISRLCKTSSHDKLLNGVYVG